MSKMSALEILEQRVTEVTDKFWDVSEAEQEILRKEYRTVLQPALLAAYGEDASGFRVDPWTGEVFSDLYKDRNGFRPSNVSYRTMMEWMANIPPLEEDEDVAQGDRFDPDISQWEDAARADDAETRARDFEEVYGVSAMGQAMHFLDMKEY